MATEPPPGPSSLNKAGRITHLEKLVYLYCGSSDVAADLAFYRNGLKAELVWRFEYSGTMVAALRLGDGPLVLLADHRPAPSVLPIWAVDDLDAAVDELKESGWTGSEHRAEVPDGTVAVLKDQSGNEIALLHRTRPHVAESMAENFRSQSSAEDP